MPEIRIYKRWLNPAYRAASYYSVVLHISTALESVLFETESAIDAMVYARNVRAENSLGLDIKHHDRTLAN